MGKEQRKFMKWWRAARKKGLIDFKLVPGNITKDTTSEDIYRELNIVNALLADPKARVAHGDVF